MSDERLLDDAIQHLSLDDKPKNAQFVKKKIHRLSDSQPTNSLDFRETIFLSENLCLNAVTKAKSWIKFLNFEECHWFSPEMFMDFPELPSLVSLNLMKCPIAAPQLLHILKMCPKLKNLALSFLHTDVDELKKKRKEWPHDWPSVNLEKLHVDLYSKPFQDCSDLEVDEGMHVNDCAKWFQDTFFPDRIPELFSLRRNDYIVDGRCYFSLSRQNVNLCPYLPFDYTREDYVETCRRLGLMHCITQTQNEGTVSSSFNTIEEYVNICHRWRLMCCIDQTSRECNISPPFDILKVKCLTLCSIPPLLSISGNFTVPHVLPDLEYLLVFYCPFLSRNALARKLMFECSFPNLKFLHLDGRIDSEDLNTFWCNFSQMKNLKDLNLTRADVVDSPLLLQTLKSLENLRSLGISMSLARNWPIDRREKFFLELSTCLPKLQKLQVVCLCWTEAPATLKPIGQMTGLKELHLSFAEEVENLASLNDVLKYLVCLTSFSLYSFWYLSMYQELPAYPEYANLLNGALKYLPKLTELTMQIPGFDISCVCKAIGKYRNLEKVSIISRSSTKSNNAEITAGVAHDLIVNIIESLPRLHVLFLRNPQFSKGVANEILRYRKSLWERGRKIILYCDCPWAVDTTLIPDSLYFSTNDEDKITPSILQMFF